MAEATNSATAAAGISAPTPTPKMLAATKRRVSFRKPGSAVVDLNASSLNGRTADLWEADQISAKGGATMPRITGIGTSRTSTRTITMPISDAKQGNGAQALTRLERNGAGCFGPRAGAVCRKSRQTPRTDHQHNGQSGAPGREVPPGKRGEGDEDHDGSDVERRPARRAGESLHEGQAQPLAERRIGAGLFDDGGEQSEAGQIQYRPQQVNAAGQKGEAASGGLGDDGCPCCPKGRAPGNRPLHPGHRKEQNQEDARPADALQ